MDNNCLRIITKLVAVYFNYILKKQLTSPIDKEKRQLIYKGLNFDYHKRLIYQVLADKSKDFIRKKPEETTQIISGLEKATNFTANYFREFVFKKELGLYCQKVVHYLVDTNCKEWAALLKGLLRTSPTKLPSANRTAKISSSSSVISSLLVSSPEGPANPATITENGVDLHVAGVEHTVGSARVSIEGTSDNNNISITSLLAENTEVTGLNHEGGKSPHNSLALTPEKRQLLSDLYHTSVCYNKSNITELDGDSIPCSNEEDDSVLNCESELNNSSSQSSDSNSTRSSSPVTAKLHRSTSQDFPSGSQSSSSTSSAANSPVPDNQNPFIYSEIISECTAPTLTQTDVEENSFDNLAFKLSSLQATPNAMQNDDAEVNDSVVTSLTFGDNLLNSDRNQSSNSESNIGKTGTEGNCSDQVSNKNPHRLLESLLRDDNASPSPTTVAGAVSRLANTGNNDSSTTNHVYSANSNTINSNSSTFHMNSSENELTAAIESLHGLVEKRQTNLSQMLSPQQTGGSNSQSLPPQPQLSAPSTQQSMSSQRQTPLLVDYFQQQQPSGSNTPHLTQRLGAQNLHLTALQECANSIRHRPPNNSNDGQRPVLAPGQWQLPQQNRPPFPGQGPSHPVQMPSHQGQVPFHQAQIPLNQGQVPSHQAQMLSHQGQAPSHPAQILSHQGQVPSHPAQILSHQGQVPSHPAQILSHQGQVPSHPVQMPSHQGQIPSHQGQMPSHQGQIPSHQVQMPSHQGQMLFQSQQRQIPFQGHMQNQNQRIPIQQASQTQNRGIAPPHIRFAESIAPQAVNPNQLRPICPNAPFHNNPNRQSHPSALPMQRPGVMQQDNNMQTPHQQGMHPPQGIQNSYRARFLYLPQQPNPGASSQYSPHQPVQQYSSDMPLPPPTYPNQRPRPNFHPQHLPQSSINPQPANIAPNNSNESISSMNLGNTGSVDPSNLSLKEKIYYILKRLNNNPDFASQVRSYIEKQPNMRCSLSDIINWLKPIMPNLFRSLPNRPDFLLKFFQTALVQHFNIDNLGRVSLKDGTHFTCPTTSASVALAIQASVAIALQSSSAATTASSTIAAATSSSTIAAATSTSSASASANSSSSAACNSSENASTAGTSAANNSREQTNRKRPSSSEPDIAMGPSAPKSPRLLRNDATASTSIVKPDPSCRPQRRTRRTATEETIIIIDDDFDNTDNIDKDDNDADDIFTVPEPIGVIPLSEFGNYDTTVGGLQNFGETVGENFITLNEQALQLVNSFSAGNAASILPTNTQSSQYISGLNSSRTDNNNGSTADVCSSVSSVGSNNNISSVDAASIGVTQSRTISVNNSNSHIQPGGIMNIAPVCTSTITDSTNSLSSSQLDNHNNIIGSDGSTSINRCPAITHAVTYSIDSIQSSQLANSSNIVGSDVCMSDNSDEGRVCMSNNSDQGGTTTSITSNLSSNNVNYHIQSTRPSSTAVCSIVDSNAGSLPDAMLFAFADEDVDSPQDNSGAQMSTVVTDYNHDAAVDQNSQQVSSIVSTVNTCSNNATTSNTITNTVQSCTNTVTNTSTSVTNTLVSHAPLESTTHCSNSVRTGGNVGMRLPLIPYTNVNSTLSDRNTSVASNQSNDISNTSSSSASPQKDNATATTVSGSNVQGNNCNRSNSSASKKLTEADLESAKIEIRQDGSDETHLITLCELQVQPQTRVQFERSFSNQASNTSENTQTSGGHLDDGANKVTADNNDSSFIEGGRIIGQVVVVKRERSNFDRGEKKKVGEDCNNKNGQGDDDGKSSDPIIILSDSESDSGISEESDNSRSTAIFSVMNNNSSSSAKNSSTGNLSRFTTRELLNYLTEKKRLFKCNTCGLRFYEPVAAVQSVVLLKHKLSHSQDSRLVCRRCGKACFNLRGLHEHWIDTCKNKKKRK